MGAAVYEASEQIYFDNSFEYLHNPKRRGAKSGVFKKYGFPTGEFSYKNLELAYSDEMVEYGKSTMKKYFENTFFCPSLNNLVSDVEKKVCSFDALCEKDERRSVSLAPFIIKGLEDEGIYSAYTHIAKGRVPINYYLSGCAADYFDQKVTDFFKDAEIKFANEEIGEKILVWHQGEADAKNGYDAYFSSLEKLWSKAKKLGFTKFLIIRVGFFGNEAIDQIMKAQEDFCDKTENAYVITRVCSFMKYFGHDDEKWIAPYENDEFLYCRDSFYGFKNQHINEKGFRTITKYAVPNIIKVLNGEVPVLEKERIFSLMGE